MVDRKNYITVAGLEDLKKEFKSLKAVERPKIVDMVSWAAGNGDRSENGDYIYGKRRLREIDQRLYELSQKIEEAEPIDPSSIDREEVVFGATVVYHTEEGKERRVQIVGEDEILPEQGKISWCSPLAKALLGKKSGDETLLYKPGGEESLQVVAIQYI